MGLYEQMSTYYKLATPKNAVSAFFTEGRIFTKKSVISVISVISNFALTPCLFAWYNINRFQDLRKYRVSLDLFYF
jgi:hypothetical protein